MKNKKLLWLIIALVSIVVVLIALKSAGVIGKEEGTKVSVEKAANRTIIETVNASGKVYPEVEVKVSPDVSGEIVELTVNEGDSVTKGQVVARIFADILASQRDQASAVVSQQQAQVANVLEIRQNLGPEQVADAQHDQTEANYNRQKKLYDDKVISRLEYEQAEQAYRSAKANYAAAQESINSSKAAVRSAQAQLTRADKDVGRTVIIAPMSGIVSLLSVKKGERVAGNSFNVGTEMMRIADMRSIEVRVDVGENDIPKVKIGDTALVEVDAYSNRKFKGLVYKIANPQTGNALGGAATTNEVTNYKVHIRLLRESYTDLIGKGRSFPFRPGMSASADIQTKTKNNVLSVPLNAVTTRSKKDEAPKSGDDKKSDKPAETNAAGENKVADDDIEEVVFVLQKDNTVKKFKVKTAVQDLNYIEVIEGIKAGDQVVTGPYNTVSKLLKEGDKVKVVEKDKLYEDKDKKN